MNTLIILADNVYLTPYINFYISVLDKLKVDYKIIYWDKNNNEIIDDSRYLRFYYKAISKTRKVRGYLKYREFVIKEIKREKYTILIPLHAIVSFVLFDLFIHNYKHRYIYDVRDYSYEKFFLYRVAQKSLVNNSTMNIISSKGFEEFLPQGEYFVTHNVPHDNYKSYRQYENCGNSTINISYIGLIRFMEQNKKILLFFKNDKRFHLNFIGTNAMQLNEFCFQNEIHNVTLIDTFDSCETLNYYKNTDLVMNLYGNNTPLLNYALSNKLYYSACLYKPILVCEGTYMEKVSKKYGIGFSLSMNSMKEKDALYHYIIQMDRKNLIHNCDMFMVDVYNDKSSLEMELIKRLQDIKEDVKNHD